MELEICFLNTLLTFLILCISCTSAIHRSWINEEKEITPYQTTNGTASHIEADQFIPDNILYSDMFALYTTDGSEASDIVGQPNTYYALPYREGVGINATFSTITAFAQVNVTHVLIADSARGCIRILDRTTNQTEQFVGICEKKSFLPRQVNGNLTHSRFGKITGFTYHHEKAFVYMFEQGGTKRITKADVKADQVITIASRDDFRDTFDYPRHGLVDNRRGMVFVTLTYGIAKINVTEDTFRYLMYRNSGGYADGALAFSEWFWPNAMSMYQSNTLIVADGNNNKLRVVDLPSTNVTTWCFNNKLNPSKLCYIQRPVSVHIFNCNVYIGVRKVIAKLRLPEWLCKEKEVYTLLTSTDPEFDDDNNQNHSPVNDVAIGGGISGGLGAVGLILVGIACYISKKRSYLRTLQITSKAEYSTFHPTAGTEGGQESAVEMYHKKTKMK